jgi:radical SAM superfamily enzyme YgiQ (UPF0313 family)
MIIVGVPSESPQTFEHKVAFAKWLGIDQPVFTIYTLFPGTPAYEEAVLQGWIELPADYAAYDMAHALMRTQHMTRKQVWTYTGWAFTSFYGNPVRLARNVFSRNDWRRRIYLRMLVYIGKQAVGSLVPRIR